ncbi:MAG TPA: valine--tRNA ligase, partial [Paracoccaceae bacterium]|nr:valine--tRNA ligase [Paracoccaceae bacterium]
MDKTFDAAAAEPRIYQQWEDAAAFKAGANASRDETFCIVIPPPNVTGSLHMGHALNNTLQDVLVRWKRMQGYDVLWQPGTDHAGIATQMVVERALAAEGNPGRREMTRDAFVDRVWQQKAESEGTILGQLKRLGASCDWSRTRFTMDEGLSAAVRKVFVQLYNEGLIYRDKRLVNWDPQFETAISDLEVEQVEEKGKLWRFRYELADGVTYRHPIRNGDGEVIDHQTRNYLVVATTRPETMLGDTGVAVNPSDERYAGLIGKHVILPLVGRRIPIVADEHADPEKGTGAVKITPAHDFNDFEVGRRHGLRQINVMTSRAAIHLADNTDFLEDCDPEPECMMLHGKDRFEARKRVVRLAEVQEWLDGIDEEMHVVPHGDRSKVPIEPYLTDQWFVNAKELAKAAIEKVRDGTTSFVPENWTRVYYNWMENIEPWCISRQLWWGHQVPVWYGPDYRFDSSTAGYHEQTGAQSIGTQHVNYSDPVAFCAPTFEEAEELAARFYKERDSMILAFAEANDQQDAITKDKDDPSLFYLWRDPDVLDTWFSSALWPFSTLGWPDETLELARYYPTDVLVTGFDIIFFWVARMMMTGLHFKGEAPFHTVYINSIVVDQHGKKMSKSQGNVIDPLQLIDEYGADALRYTLAAQEVQGRRQLRLAVDAVQAGRNFGTKLWNAARFAEMNGCYGHAPALRQPEASHTVNRWIIGETARTAEAVDRALSAYRFNEAAGALYDHIWKVFCDWYMELAKPLLQGEDQAAKTETQRTMAWALDQCLVLLHPIMPFLTEALWGQLDQRDRLLIHAPWPQLDPAEVADPAADAEIRWVIRLIDGIRSVRAELNVPPKAPIAMVLT